jgi:hypothetical protein
MFEGLELLKVARAHATVIGLSGFLRGENRYHPLTPEFQKCAD